MPMKIVRLSSLTLAQGEQGNGVHIVRGGRGVEKAEELCVQTAKDLNLDQYLFVFAHPERISHSSCFR